MEITTKDITAWCLTEIDKLVNSRLFESNWEIYRVVAEAAGLSAMTVKQFHNGKHQNLSTSNLDSVVAAIKAIQQRLRAA